LNQIGNVFIFIGPPGAGKGSLANLCTKRFGWMQVSTGNLCRKHIAEETKIGKEIDLIIKSGKLISDDIITSMVSEWLNDNAQKTSGVIFDGYPRTIAQAEAFEKILKTVFFEMHEKIVLFLIPDDVVVDRLCRRFICQNKDCQAVYSIDSKISLDQVMICNECGAVLGRRGDDEEGAVRRRLSVYHKHEQELVNFYRNNGTEIIELDAAKPLQEVFKVFLQKIDE
jgi:adenylate kinase